MANDQETLGHQTIDLEMETDLGSRTPVIASIWGIHIANRAAMARVCSAINESLLDRPGTDDTFSLTCRGP